MKKFFVIAIAAIASLGASAEGFYAGGSFGLWHEGSAANDPATNQFTILPEVGYSFNNHIGVGATLGYTNESICGYGISNNIFNFNPYARYTFFRSKDNLVNLFVDGGIELGFGWQSYGDDSSDTAVVYGIGVRPGIAINITKKFSLVSHLGFFGYKGGNDTAKAIGEKTQAGLNFDSRNVTFGFYYNF